MGGGYFYGVESPGGNGAYGYYLHADGTVDPISSGRADLLDTPEGTWAIGPREHDGLHQGKNAYKYRLHPVGTGLYTPIPDPRYKGKDHPGQRTEVEIHNQHGTMTSGSHGCVADQNEAGVDKVGKDGTLTVDYSSHSLEEAQKKIEAQAGKSIDWTKIAKPVPPRGTTPGSGDQSKTKKGGKVKAKNLQVMVGRNQRLIAHREAPLEGGGMVAQGTSSIKVGWEQYDVAAVTHDTTDGSPIANGEDSVHMLV